jgi:hypothetical protein
MGYGFASIPDSANVVGITLNISKSRTGPGSVFDSTVALVDANGQMAPDNKALPGAWLTSSNTSYGGVNDTWGRSWTGADVKSSFGWVVVANTTRNDSLFADFNVRLDCATVSICYVP